jgi:hypothetical protein
VQVAFVECGLVLLLIILIFWGRSILSKGKRSQPQVSMPSLSPVAESLPSPIAEVVPDKARAEPQELLHDDELNTMQLNVNSENQ